MNAEDNTRVSEPSAAADALAVADGRLDEERATDVSRALRESEAYRREFAATLLHDSLLREMAPGEGHARELSAPAKSPWVATAVAAALVAGIGFALFRPAGDGQLAGTGVTISRGTSPVAGSELPVDGHAPTRIALRTGGVALRLPDGKRVDFAAPVDGTFSGSGFLRLAHGRVTVDVPEGADGLTVDTPNGRITDLGTRYGVNARGASDEVVVFDGEVEFTPTDRPANAKRLLEGEAATLTANGTATPVSSVINEVTRTSWEIGPTQRPDAVIRHVTDNNRDRFSYKVYQVVVRGMFPGEKAWPYSTNEPLWWPAPPSSGEFSSDLHGADLARVLQQELDNAELEISVTLGRPARLFVIFESGAPLPDWLTGGYSRTGEQVVLSPSNPATHPDEPFQTTFDVWAREVPEPGTVTLGAVEKADVNSPPFYLYGIAAKALE